MSEVKWIKLSTELFDNRKIRQIESLPDGHTIIVVWLKLLCIAGNINDSGFIYFTKEIPYTEQMLATQFNTQLSTIQFALKTFQEFEMIEIIDNILHISNWEKYQNVEGMERIRQQNRLRKARFDQKKRLEISGNVTSNVTVTQSNATDKEEDIDIDKDIDKEYINYQKIVSLYHSICKSYPTVKSLSDARKKAIKARLKSYNIDDFKTLFEKAEASSFLKGANERNWSANFDWLIKDSSMAKVLDGNYDSIHKANDKNKFNHFEQNTYDFDDLEKKLLKN